MAITDVKAKIITDYLNSDPKQAKSLLALNPEEALVKISGGLNQSFTLDEIVSYGEFLKKAISDVALEGVAGGAGEADAGEDVLVILGVKLGWKAIAGIAGGAGVVTGIAQDIRW